MICSTWRFFRYHTTTSFLRNFKKIKYCPVSYDMVSDNFFPNKREAVRYQVRLLDIFLELHGSQPSSALLRHMLTDTSSYHMTSSFSRNRTSVFWKNGGIILWCTLYWLFIFWKSWMKADCFFFLWAYFIRLLLIFLVHRLYLWTSLC